MRFGIFNGHTAIKVKSRPKLKPDIKERRLPSARLKPDGCPRRPPCGRVFSKFLVYEPPPERFNTA
jgi:hypothetical protein